MFGRRLRAAALVAALAVAATGCEYWGMARDARDAGAPVPWFCDPVAYNSVTLSGMGFTNFYEGQTRQPLSYNECMTVALQFDKAKAYAEQYPTLGAAVDAGFDNTFNFIPGMGTHHGLDSISPELLADPTFDPLHPIIPNSIIDDVFDPAQPEFLQYNGNGRDAVLVGMSYYVRTDTGLPPEGFVGNNDWWHHHPTLCLDRTTAVASSPNISDATCASRDGVNVHLQDYYMLHLWVVDDLEYHADVHAPMHPCILSTGAIFDMDDPCHDNYTPADTTSTASASLASTTGTADGSADSTGSAGSARAAALHHDMGCGMATLPDETTT